MLKCEKKKGFTQIEMIVVIGIVSVITTVVYFIQDSVSDRRQVSSEFSNVSKLVEKINSATTASSYAGLDNQKLIDMGIYYQSEFKDFEIKGLSNNSFQVNYNLLSSRMCNDFAMKTAVMKGEYKLTRKVNDVEVGFTPGDVANLCDNQQNKIELVFEGLNIQNIAMVNPGVPKPPPVYADEGALNPAYPDRGDVPTNLSSSAKSVDNPNRPVIGTYIPPSYIVASVQSPTPSTTVSNPSGVIVRPQYEKDNPLGPLVNPPDMGNEWVPAVPPIPPRPEAIAPPPPPSSYRGDFKVIRGSANRYQPGNDGYVVWSNGSENEWYVPVVPEMSAAGGRPQNRWVANGMCLVGYYPVVKDPNSNTVFSNLEVMCHKS